MLTNVMYAVDEFRLYEDDDGLPRLLCRGWLHCRQDFSHVPNASLRLRITAPGGPGLELPVTNVAVRRGDVGRIIGEEATTAGFHLDAEVSDVGYELGRSRLVVGMPDGGEMSIDVGKRLIGRFPDPGRIVEERALVMKFEGIGNNCEFGLMQRKVGFNRMGLLRFAGSIDTRKVAEAIRNRFEGFATPDDLDLSLRGTEWIAHSRRYGMSVHTYKHAPAVSEAQIREDESTLLRFQAEMMLDLLEAGSRIFVRRVSGFDRDDGMLELHDAIRSHGPTPLLWVTEAHGGRPHGTIEHLGDRLYLGLHGKLAPTGWPTEFDKESWMSLIAAAYTVITADTLDLQARM